MGIALFIFFSKVFATPNPCLRLASMNTFAMHMRARHAALCSRATASLATSSNRAKTYITKANRRQASQISTPIFTRTLATQTIQMMNMAASKRHTFHLGIREELGLWEHYFGS